MLPPALATNSNLGFGTGTAFDNNDQLPSYLSFTRSMHSNDKDGFKRL
jgi:hypothetical protein